MALKDVHGDEMQPDLSRGNRQGNASGLPVGWRGNRCSQLYTDDRLDGARNEAAGADLMTAEEGVMWLEMGSEILRTGWQIHEALWQNPADLDRAKLLISKRMGLRICLGEVKVKLKKPVVRIVELADAA